MLSAGIVSFYHPGSLLLCRHEPPVSTWPSTKIHHQISLRMHSCFFPSQVFEGSFQPSFHYYRHIKCETARRNGYHGFSSDDGFDQKPFWLTMVHDIAQSLRSLALFLLEQPSQLKYIEWPPLESTAKTATLTLILVALLIVSLASVDSFLCYILALLVRKTA
ncbi:uncharacterized protein LOC110113241 isoform X1 [Dendrobium catenatum]|uniref:uncharacterized protein LOC110113241 isoform X1 n=1 Tax=Dendrobium catenatum TaxID=906689 RepID=UPI0009F195AD|nr:uncharacterized protein LOC110113241 isoform X1 [Dendrobium catenatum]